MGKSCYLCKMMFIKGDSRRSFHKFPDAQYQKEAWCQSLKMDIKKVRGWTFICSDHFVPESFTYRLNGTRFLKDDAVPLFYKGPVRPRKPKRKKYDILEAECETQENENRALDKKIKFETPRDSDEDKNISIKTEQNVEEPSISDIVKTEDIFVKTEVKTEITEEIDIKEEFTLLPPNVDVGVESKEMVKSFELKEEFSECEEEISEQSYVKTRPDESSDTADVLAVRFNETYPWSGDVYACVECAFQTAARNAMKRHFMVHRDAEFKAMSPARTKKEQNKNVTLIKKKVDRKAGRRTYSEEDLRIALFEIRENKMAIRQACRTFNVPKTTVLDRLSGRVPDNLRKPGPPPLLTVEGENQVKKWLIDSAKCGFPAKKETLLNAVSKIAADTGREIFKDGIPHDTWYKNFIKRNPEVTSMVEADDKAVTGKEGIRKWFRELNQFLSDKKLLEVFSDPGRVFNGDLVEFDLCRWSGKVMGPKGFKNVYDRKPGEEQVTVLILFNVSGKFPPPLVVFPDGSEVESVPSSWVSKESINGCVTSKIFFDYVTNDFHKWMITEDIKKPIIIFVDGLRSHMTYALSQWCDRNQVVLYALPQNTTHIVQPGDVSVFRPIKSEWAETVRDWQCDNEENMNFTSVIGWVLSKEELEESIKDGFRTCGLFPLNPKVVNRLKCVEIPKELMVKKKDEITQRDIASAKRVLKKLRPKLKAQGINVKVVMDEVDSLWEDPELYQYKTHRCKDCNYVAIQKHNLVRHMVKHLPTDGSQGVKVFSCDDCDYFTKYRCDLVKHQAKHLNTERRFKCTKCSYGTNEAKHLKEHMIKGHIEGKKYKYECEKCPYKTDCRGSLNRHVRASHSEIRTFKYECENCSFKTESKWSRNKHMKSHIVEKKREQEEGV